VVVGVVVGDISRCEGGGGGGGADWSCVVLGAYGTLWVRESAIQRLLASFALSES